MVKIHGNRVIAIFSDVNFSPQLLRILEELCDRGVELLILLIGSSDLQIAKQIQLREWNSKILVRRGKYGSLINLLLVAGEIFRFKPSTLLASGQFATALGVISSKLLNVPRRVYIRHHSNYHHKFKMKFGIMIDKVCNRFATNVVAVSQTVKNILVEEEQVNPDKIILIYNGVDLHNFRAELIDLNESTELDDYRSSCFHIGVISRLTEWKGVEYVAAAFVEFQREFPQARLHIVGAFADSYRHVKQILSTLSPESYSLVQMHTNVSEFLRELDVFVHVPIGMNDEAFGIVYLESLSIGIPCIFTKSGILNELDAVEKYVHIVNFRNSEEIYLNLKKMIMRVNDKKSPVPQSWLDQFSLDLMAKKYADLLLSEVY